MFKAFQAIFGALVLTVSLSAYGQTMTITTAKGEQTLAGKPETMVVFDLLSLDTLDALGVTLKAKPNNLKLDYIDNFVANPVSIGTSSQPNYENIVKMNPDLIVVGGGSSRLMKPLSAIAPTIDMYVSSGDYVAQMLSRLENFALITATQERGEQLKQAFLSKLTQAQSAVQGKGKTLIVMTNGNKLSTFGLKSRFGWLFSDVGLVPAMTNIDPKSHGESISFEYIAKVDPDYLLVVDRAAAIGRQSQAAAVTLDTPLVKQTKAGKAGNIIYLTPGPAYVTGSAYQGMNTVLDELIAAYGD
ncbi:MULTISPECIES: siderophore ABC transporter substrate-binding protein [unclassified Vibrio]|uniref:Siderophore ABC transporter substrate-binding protein n=1 Tax=Vibrio sp. HB236076 TaxID=3232307 RepID=A0AB39HFM6_9VIBR|nr:siderophore ABC transporter substrate-binding protein [Vibrio sp. HB161653]MDP5255540.1 siderophore ABC transporter substrate-binding protein [Vibrio sp. HB161653]